jgi:transposase
VADVKEILVHWDAGATVSQIGRTLGYSRPTVRKYVEAAQRVGLERGGGRRGEADWDALAGAVVERVAHRRPVGAMATEVGRFHAYLAERLGEVRPSVLYQRLHDEQGLQASWATFYRYLRQHWPERLRSAPRTTVRLDDPPPGSEAQVDFFYVGLWDDPEAGRRRRLYAFLMTLSHSRHQFLYPVLAEDGQAWQEGHAAAFTFFGGVPRRVVPDNLTPGIVKADRYDPRLNRAYGELARHYGCLIDPARVHRPTDKPRVERTVSYARESFFRGRTGDDLAGLRTAARRWCLEVAGRRIHGTTGERPLVAFREREQAALLPLPDRPWQPVVWTSATVHPDCHLQAKGARYSVPYRYVGQRLEVRLSPVLVEIYASATLVASHVRRHEGRSTTLEHYPEASQAFLRATPQACLRRAQAIGAATETVVRTLLADHALHHLREVQAILRLEERFGAERVERACARAQTAGDGRYRTVRGILEHDLDAVAVEAEPTTAPTGRAFLHGPDALLASSQPDAEVE